MSLKSKLEAVIYASEEPVTLAQLATLFGAEALEWDSARKAAESSAAQNAAADANATAVDPSQPLVSDGLEYIDLHTEDDTRLEQPGFAVLPAPGASAGSTPREPASETNPDTPVIENAEEIPSQTSESSEPPAPNELVEPQSPEQAPLDPEAEAKRLARQRDRDIKSILRLLIDELITD